MKRYQKKTVEQFMAYLNEIGLSVYGPSMTQEGEETGALMDYDADAVVARRKYITKGTLRKFGGLRMKITDIEAFKDAQLMARIAVSNLSNSIPADAFWFAAMQTLKAAYAGEKK